MSPAVLIFVLFTRLDAPSLLAHGTRRAMLDLVRERPGARVGEIARAMRLDYKTALHHARMLARAGLLVVDAAPRRQACYLPGARRGPTPPTPAAVAALRAVHAGAGTPAMLARALGVPRGTAGSLLARLARRGLVARDASGAHVLTARARAGLAPDEGFWPEGGIGDRWSGSPSAS